MVNLQALAQALHPYTTEAVARPYYSLEVSPGIGNDPYFYLIDFRLEKETAIAFHLRLNKRSFRVVEMGPKQVSNYDALVDVFDRAKAFVEALKHLDFSERP